MFKSKATLSNTLGKVNQFILDLKNGIDMHKQEVESINEEIDSLQSAKDELQNEIFQASKLIGTLSGTNN